MATVRNRRPNKGWIHNSPVSEVNMSTKNDRNAATWQGRETRYPPSKPEWTRGPTCESLSRF